MANNNLIRVYEHMLLRQNDVIDGVIFTSDHLHSMQNYFGKGCPFFNLVHNGVKFKEYVGVLQVKGLTIEVLPKTEKSVNSKTNWHGFLIDMLRTVGFLDVEDTGYSLLNIKSNSILDLYIQLFVKETRYLLQTGLIKKYRLQEANSLALKGKLLFGKNIQQNLVHGERFYVKHTVYDQDNVFNQVLFKALALVNKLNTAPALKGQISGLAFDFPECSDLVISEKLFDNITFNRKTESYSKAIAIAKMLLLNYHPDIRTGHNNVLALMFDMNKLWERYVYKIIKKQLSGKYIVRQQVGANFWEPLTGRVVKVYPDIVVYDLDSKERITVLDTKWKNISGTKPSDDDLKQMLVYNLYYDCSHSALLYPSTNQAQVKGTYMDSTHGHCSLLFMELIRLGNSFRLDLDKVVAHVERVRSDSAADNFHLI